MRLPRNLDFFVVPSTLTLASNTSPYLLKWSFKESTEREKKKNWANEMQINELQCRSNVEKKHVIPGVVSHDKPPTKILLQK